jgi:hypothetical protein
LVTVRKDARETRHCAVEAGFWPMLLETIDDRPLFLATVAGRGYDRAVRKRMMTAGEAEELRGRLAGGESSYRRAAAKALKRRDSRHWGWMLRSDAVTLLLEVLIWWQWRLSGFT